MRVGGDPVNLSNGLLNLTNWLGNVIMPTMAALFAAAAVYRFSKAHSYSHVGYAALASLMCSGLLRAMESFSNQATWNNPDRYWISVLTLANWNRTGRARGCALFRLIGADDDWRGLGAQPSRCDVLL
jgi:hypothetical protein